MLFYAVCAWTDDFTGYVIDYGTYPDQLRRYFTLRDSARTMAAELPVAGVEGVIHVGLEKLAGQLLGTSWTITGGGAMRIDQLLIDSGYLPGVVGNVCHKVGAGSVVLPSKGVGIKAGNKPMAAYQRHPGEKYGWHWYMPNVNRTNEFKHVLIDTNHWKTFIHSRFAVAAGDGGSFSLFGRSPAEHRLLADHVAAAET